MSDFWVFGYGSLMWRPGFPHLDETPARLLGVRRALCVYSMHHRGTPEKPGLVLGLDRGGSCRGVAFRVAGADREAVLAYLRDRELVTDVYREVSRPVVLGDAGGSSVMALTYVADRRHAQYAGGLEPEAVLALVKRSAGKSGTNAEYVINTVRHMKVLGIRDAGLEWLAERLDA